MWSVLLNQVITQKDLETGSAFTGSPSQHPQAEAAWACPAFLAGSEGRFWHLWLGLFSLLHEEVYYNEAAFVSF